MRVSMETLCNIIGQNIPVDLTVFSNLTKQKLSLFLLFALTLFQEIIIVLMYCCIIIVKYATRIFNVMKYSTNWEYILPFYPWNINETSSFPMTFTYVSILPYDEQKLYRIQIILRKSIYHLFILLLQKLRKLIKCNLISV